MRDGIRQLVPGDLFAGCRIESLAGHGGMGLVYRACQVRAQRIVAVKVIKPELAGDSEFRARFEQEASLAAKIEHPNVIPIYDIGDEDDLLYIVMRFVENTDLGDLLRRQARLAPGHAARMVTQIAAALDAAHQHGLVHRDVKPANVLVTGVIPNEHLYLTDFGLTKRVDGDRMTPSSHFVGTPDYISPEQLGGKVDARADVYALGCVLYQLLTGAVPFPRADDWAKVFAHLSLEPPLPSRMVPSLPAALDAVITRAMAKDPDARFQSAGQLARAARDAAGSDATFPAGPLEVVRPGAPGIPAANTPEPSEQHETGARGESAILDGPASPASPGASTVATQRQDRGDVGSTHPCVLAGHASGVLAVVFSPDGRVLASAGSDGSVRLWDPITGRPTATLHGQTAPVRSVAFSSDACVLACAGSDGSVRLWDTTTGEEIGKLVGHAGWVLGVAFSHHGGVLASAGFDGSVILWDTDSGEPTTTFEGHTRAVRGVAFSPDDCVLASPGGDRTVRLWRVADGQPAAALEGHTRGVRGVAFSPDGRMLATAGDDRSVRLWNATVGGQIAMLEGHTRAVRGVALSPDGKLVASAGGNDRSVRLWGAVTGEQTATLEGHARGVLGVAFSPDGTLLASAGEDGLVRLWLLLDRGIV